MSIIKRPFLLALVAVLAVSPVAFGNGDDYDFSDACKAQLENLTQATLGASMGIKIRTKPGKQHSGISPMDGKTHWLKGLNTGIKNGVLTMTLYPSGIVNDSGKKLSQSQLSSCDPFAIGYTLGVTIHEYLHGICGAHDTSGASDCVGIAIGIAMTNELCKDVGDINACLAGECPADSPYAGKGAEELQKLKDGMCKRIGDATDRHNGKTGSEHAANCAGTAMPDGCLPESYNDTMPSPPSGWEPPEEGETGDWPIPACPGCST